MRKQIGERTNTARRFCGDAYVERRSALTVVRSNDLIKGLHLGDCEAHVLSQAGQVSSPQPTRQC